MGGPGSGPKPIESPRATQEMIDRRVTAARRSVDALNPTETGMVIVALAAQVAELVALLRDARPEVVRGMPKQIFPATRKWLASIDETLARIGATP